VPDARVCGADSPRARTLARKGGVVDVPHYGNRFFRSIVTLLEWILKKVTGPGGWRPAGAIRELPPSALVYDSREESRAEGVFRMLAALGFSPQKVSVAASSGDLHETCGTISRGAEDCWATVVLEPLDAAGAIHLGAAFRQYAHLHPDVVALVVGPLPSRSEILDRYRHVVTADDGSVATAELAAGVAHASAARVLHCARLLNTAVAFFALAALIVGIGLACVGWFIAWR
jgi:hypothetical protein